MSFSLQMRRTENQGRRLMSDDDLHLWTRTESPERYNGSSEDHVAPSHAKMLHNAYPKSFHTSEALQPAFSEVTADVANSEKGRESMDTGSIKEEIMRIVTQLRTDGDPDGELLEDIMNCIPLTYPGEQLDFGHLYEEHPEIRRLQHLLQKLLQSEDDDLEWFKRLVADIVAEINPGIKGVLDRITISCNKNLGQEKKILIQLRKFVEELMEGDAGAQNRKPTSLENDIRSLHPKYWSTVLQLVHNTKRKLDLVHFNRLLEAAIKGKSIVEIEQMIEFVNRIAYDHPSVGMDLMLNPIDGSSEIMRLMYDCPDVDLKSGYVALATQSMVSAEVEQPKVLKRSAAELEGAKKRPKKGK